MTAKLHVNCAGATKTRLEPFFQRRAVAAPIPNAILGRNDVLDCLSRDCGDGGRRRRFRGPGRVPNSNSLQCSKKGDVAFFPPDSGTGRAVQDDFQSSLVKAAVKGGQGPVNPRSNPSEIARVHYTAGSCVYFVPTRSNPVKLGLTGSSKESHGCAAPHHLPDRLARDYAIQIFIPHWTPSLFRDRANQANSSQFKPIQGRSR